MSVAPKLRKLMVVSCVLSLLQNLPVHADQEQNDAIMFDKLFASWTRAFNQKDLSGAGKLFSKDCVASSPGEQQRNYESIYSGFKKTFAKQDKSYQYKYKIRNIYRSSDLATVRITWYLSIYEKNKLISNSEEQGIDIFKQNQNGTWEIVNFIAYSEEAK